jgi:dihydrofolate synthase/folylpolyglutamate synthase
VLTYVQAVAALTARGRFGIRLGLGRTRALLRELGNPQDGFRGALVAGTNGKGSVLALVGSALREAGYRAGETPKPHLVSYRERLQIGGRPIAAAAFAELVERVLPLAKRIARRLGEPTEFELLTAMIYRWFADSAVDLAVVEVGLGGRLDATHAWDGGVAVVTNVELDHVERLGPTIPLIAKEKAAIIMRGDRAVTGAANDALPVIRRRARKVGAPLVEVEPAPLLDWDRDGITVQLPRLGRTRVGLRGRHQAANAAVADATLDALAEAGIAEVSDDDRRAGFERAVWPGRLELVSVDGRDVLLDGAHNPAGAAALAQALHDLRPFLRGPGGSDGADEPLTVVVAAMADKDVDGIADAVLGAAGVSSVVCTSLAFARAMPAEALAGRWSAAAARRGRRVTVRPVADPDGALEQALDEAPGPVVVAGSLYLVGHVRARLVRDPLLDDPEEPQAR